jgi:hypothetical protein
MTAPLNKSAVLEAPYEPGKNGKAVTLDAPLRAIDRSVLLACLTIPVRKDAEMSRSSLPGDPAVPEIKHRCAARSRGRSGIAMRRRPSAAPSPPQSPITFFASASAFSQPAPSPARSALRASFMASPSSCAFSREISPSLASAAAIDSGVG